MRAAKVQASLRIRAVSPEPSLLAHTSSESRGTFRQKARSLAPLNVWACAVKICHDGMLEDTNSLDGAHFMFSILCFAAISLLDLCFILYRRLSLSIGLSNASSSVFFFLSFFLFVQRVYTYKVIGSNKQMLRWTSGTPIIGASSLENLYSGFATR